MNDILTKNILEELPIADLPIDDREEFFVALAEGVKSRVDRKIISLLSEKELAELNKMLDKKNPDVLKFLQEKIKNFDEVVLQEIADYKTVLLERWRALQ